MTVETKRTLKKIAKNSFWIASDAVFIGLKAIGTLALIAVTTGVVFAFIFLYYVRTDLATGLEINPADFSMSRSSVICYVDSVTGQEREQVTIQSTQFRRWVDYDEFPEHLIDALVAIEDHRFFTHQGVDWFRTAGAFMNMFLSMRDTFGGSTITQQVIKNLTHEDDVTVQRKLQEVFRALEYEKQYEKSEILELYLNLVYFGHGCYGIGAAAYYYFDKEVSDLTLPESAAIIGITNNPSKFSPYSNREENKDRQEVILNRMFELGYIKTENALRQAVNSRLNFQRGVDDEADQIIYTWFEEAVMRDVIDDLVNVKGYSAQAARRLLYTGGLRIIATIDHEMQAIVDNIYQYPDNLPRVTGSVQQLQSGIILADPYTGEIKALSGGVGIKTRNILLNRATSTRRPPGSAIKPISVYAPALEYGLLTPDTLYNDSADVQLRGTTWMPRNAARGSYSGMVTVRTALRNSINTIPAIILDQLTPSISYQFMTEVLGFKLSGEDENYAPLAAGQLTYGATVREMASAYTMFPNFGQRVDLRTYSKVYYYDGSILLDNTPNYTPAISDVSAYWMTSMLHDAVVSGTGGSANLGRDMPTAGKTGTSSDSKDRWFVGFTPYYLAAVWTGFDTPAEMTSSGNPAAQIWKMIMEPIHEELETRDFHIPVNTELAPIDYSSTLETAMYTIRCVDNFGNVLLEKTEREVVGTEITENAPELEGYRLIGQSFGAVEVTADPTRNIIVFIYESALEEEPDEPDPTEPPPEEIPTLPPEPPPTDPPPPTEPPVTETPTDSSPPPE